jgi:hypothetical protein
VLSFLPREAPACLTGFKPRLPENSPITSQMCEPLSQPAALIFAFGRHNALASALINVNIYLKIKKIHQPSNVSDTILINRILTAFTTVIKTMNLKRICT